MESTRCRMTGTRKMKPTGGFYGDSPFLLDSVTDSTQSNHVFVGYGADFDTTKTDTFWYEDIAEESLYPKNIYLAQLEFKNMPDPNYPMPEPPPPQPCGGHPVEGLGHE